MADEATLELKVRARIEELEKQMRKASAAGDRAADDIENRFSKLNVGASALKGFFAGLTVDRLVRALADANAEMAKIGVTARKIGIDVDAFQKLQLAGRDSGVSREQTASGLEKFADLYKQITDKESELGKLFKVNGISLHERNGTLISFNTALARTADLFMQAASEGDKIKLAESLGLPRDLIPLLERGAEKIAELGRSAEASGLIISREIIDKARDFDEAWEKAWDNFSIYSKAALTTAFQSVAALIAQAAGLGKALLDGPTTETREPLTFAVNPDADIPLPPRRPAGMTGAATRLPPKKGGGGESDADKAQSRLEKYIETLIRQEAVEKAIADTIGESKAAQQAAVEIARAQVDLSKLDEATRKRITEQLTAQVVKLEQQREATERVRQAQRSVNDLLEFAGNSAIDAIERLTSGTASWNDVLADVLRSLSRMALQAAILGQGPLAGLFGVGGSSGNVGGLAGMFLGGLKSLISPIGSPLSIVPGRASGGPVRAGMPYIVGEKRPELFVPDSNGRIIPRLPTAPRVPNLAASRGPNRTYISMSIDLTGANGDETIKRIAGDAARRAASVAIKAANDNFVARQQRLQLLGS